MFDLKRDSELSMSASVVAVYNSNYPRMNIRISFCLAKLLYLFPKTRRINQFVRLDVSTEPQQPSWKKMWAEVP